ncbi:phage tail assembly chaperone [uncultured Clostridium sp.]|uniref:phage tail assembly chaperone n=1 Tax=uncultured Clostridium sp. TaxID=59620 RepID=UPI0025F1D7E9|nr:hypothetical protein [uncultured Clostridium sp.]
MITVDRIIKEKLEICNFNDKRENYKVKRLGDDIELKAVDVERLLDLTYTCKNEYTAQIRTVYEGVTEPNLKDKDLWKQLGVSIGNPYEVVKKIFKPYEIIDIANKILEISGLNEVPSKNEMQEEIKN